MERRSYVVGVSGHLPDSAKRGRFVNPVSTFDTACVEILVNQTQCTTGCNSCELILIKTMIAL